MYIFSFCVAAIVSEEHRFLCVFILACWHWCKPGVITSVSARSCYISVVTRDVMGCECERVCERVKSSLMWALGPRPRESPESTQKKMRKKISRERFLPLWGHFSVKLPPTFPRAPHHGGPRCHGDLIAQFSPSSLDPFWWNPAQFSPACVQMYCRLYCRDVFLEQSCR